MADYVPSNGPWQTDSQLQLLLTAAKSAGTPYRGNPNTAPMGAWKAFNDYVNANRQRLGIPDNYYPDPRTNGQTLYDPNQNQLRDAALTGGAMLGGAAALGTLGPFGGGGFSPAAEVGAIDAKLAGAGLGGGGGLSSLLTPAGAAKAALTGGPAVLAALQGFGGGGGPFGDGQDGLVDEIRQSIASQRERFDATQPAFETAQNMAMGMAPTRYRSGPFGGR